MAKCPEVAEKKKTAFDFWAGVGISPKIIIFSRIFLWLLGTTILGNHFMPIFEDWLWLASEIGGFWWGNPVPKKIPGLDLSPSSCFGDLLGEKWTWNWGNKNMGICGPKNIFLIFFCLQNFLPENTRNWHLPWALNHTWAVCHSAQKKFGFFYQRLWKKSWFFGKKAVLCASKTQTSLKNPFELCVLQKSWFSSAPRDDMVYNTYVQCTFIYIYEKLYETVETWMSFLHFITESQTGDLKILICWQVSWPKGLSCTEDLRQHESQSY